MGEFLIFAGIVLVIAFIVGVFKVFGPFIVTAIITLAVCYIISKRNKRKGIRATLEKDANKSELINFFNTCK